ncbi:F-box/RNI-like superfamily protein [Rhynchospora pubera]|uniref:F-box/RNI-like superfamily protein n=1 Tax=Rhynchospora pubera TaxID=906938 RepID=A0AAV8GV20_9POAL|nr:F-box/RNI-like superfamily protein [Rhynchospora pubera]
MEQAGKSMRGDKDRISSLPDSLIHRIMSFLTAQEAVQTCVLAKRWKNLWTTLPFLDFDLHKFMCDGEPDDVEWDDSESEDARRNPFHKFRDFVTMAILLRDSSDLHKFRISCKRFEQHNYHSLIRSWILYSLKHNPKVLDINAEPVDSLPLAVFTCASLVDASLSSFTSVRTIKVVNLPCLRRLHLNWIILDQAFIEKLFFGCPMLEFLHLENCCWEFSSINSRSLKYLKIQCCCLRGEIERQTFSINTPNLLSFCYRSCLNVIGCRMFLKMPSLTSASIYSYWPYNGRNNILTGLSKVQNLKLSGRSLKELLENELSSCPDFSYVKNLSVNYLNLSCHFNLFASFLNHFPNLEKLSLQHVGCSSEDDVDRNQESSKVAPFMGKRLERVDVKFHRSDRCFPRVVKYLQDITEKSQAQINITSLDDWSSQDWDLDISEHVWQHW